MKKTLYYKDAWFKAEYIINEGFFDFKCYKIMALDENNIEESDFESDYCLNGTMKWDGCCEFEYSEHYCGIHNAEQFYLLMKEIYKFKEYLDRDNIFIY